MLILISCLFKGEGIVEMGSPQVTCSSEDDEAHISVIRKFACAFAAQVQWSAADGDAEFGKHYNLNEGYFVIFSIFRSIDFK